MHPPRMHLEAPPHHPRPHVPPARAGALLLLLAATSAGALSDAPREPLLRMISRARAIALVRVEGVSVVKASDTADLKGTDFDFMVGLDYRAVDHVRVLETLVGELPPQLLLSSEDTWRDVGPGMYAAPEPYTPVPHAETFLVFLGPDDPDLPFEPLLHWGRVFLADADERAAFRSWILEGARLLRAHRGREVPATKQRAWLLRGACRRATRGFALESLIPSAWRFPTPGRPRPPSPLSEEEQRILMDGFVKEPTTDHSFAQVLALVVHVPHPAFDRTAVAALRTALVEDADASVRGEAPYTLSLLLDRLRIPRATERLARWEGRLGPGESRAIWRELEREGLVPRGLPLPAARTRGTD